MPKFYLLFLVLVIYQLSHVHSQRGDDCGTGYGCFSVPANCMNQTNPDSPTCEFIYKFKTNPSDGNVIDFILTGKVRNPSSAYLAIGFAYEEKMSNSSIVICRYNSDLKLGAVEHHYTSTYTTPNLIDPNMPSLGISNAQIQMRDDLLICSFSRSKWANETYSDKFFDIGLKDTLHILAAKGDLSELGAVEYHYKRGCSPSKVNFDMTESTAAMVSEPNVRLIKAHGSLMIIAWLRHFSKAFFASVGILLPRYMKFLFPKRKFAQVDFWFFMHRLLMTCVPVISLIAFIIILASKGWSWVDSSSTREFIHSIAGILTIGFLLLQTLFGYFRPDKDAAIRPVFNWSHRLLGFSTFLLSVATISIAFHILIPGKNWLLVLAWIIWVFVVPIVFEILDAKRHRVTVAINTGDENGLKLQDEQKSPENYDKMKIVLFVVHFVVQIIISAALVDYLLVFY